jgi:signal peptidase I
MDNPSNSGELVPTPQKKKSTLVADLLDYIEIFVVAICVVIAIFCFSGIRLCTVDGPSMENTLLHNEKLITSNLFYTPKRGDIVVFHQTSDEPGGYNKPIVKRVIGVAGDTVRIDYRTWTVTVTDKDGNVTVVDEPYRKLVDGNPYPSMPVTVYVEEGTVFVMGDNRNHSADSRSDKIGLVDTRRILGKVILRVTPFDRFGTVE